MSGYPATTFRIDGDPSAIRSSASGWREFAEQAASAASQIRGLDSSLFIGPEGDQYRDGLSTKLPPHLQVTSDAYGGVATALMSFAASLDDLQDQMRPWTVRAPNLWADLTAAQKTLEAAKASDTTHQQDRIKQEVHLQPGQVLPADTYRPETGSAAAALSAAQQAWNHALSTAQGLKADLSAAIDRCADAINAEAHTRFAPNPSGLSGFVDGVQGFVKDHVAGLAKLSSILKTVSMVAGIIALVPGLDIIAAPIAILAGAGALAIDATTMWATGHYNATTLALDTLAVIPGGKLAEAGGALIRITSRGATALTDTLTDAARITRAATAGAKAAAKSLTTDIQEVRIGVAALPDGGLVVMREGKTATQMLTDAGNEAKAAYKDVRNGATPARDLSTPHGAATAEAQTFGKFSSDDLRAAAEAPDRNGFTQVGRALQKHSDREGSVFWGLSSGTAAVRNEQGLNILNEILEDPGNRTEVLDRVTNVLDSTGRGIRFSNDGTLMGFLEPRG